MVGDSYNTEYWNTNIDHSEEKYIKTLEKTHFKILNNLPYGFCPKTIGFQSKLSYLKSSGSVI